MLKPSRTLWVLLALGFACLTVIALRSPGKAGTLAVSPLPDRSSQGTPQGEMALTGKAIPTKSSYDLASSGCVPLGGTTVPGATVTVRIKDVQIEGAQTPAVVKKVLEAEQAKLGRSCQDAVKRGFRLPAEITLVFTEGTDGRVSAEPLGKPPLAVQGFEKCLAATVGGLQFPPPLKAPVQVTIKLALAAG